MSRQPLLTKYSVLRHVARTTAQAALRGCAAAAGSAPVDLVVWWITRK
jgi:hypothetical protein